MIAIAAALLLIGLVMVINLIPVSPRQRNVCINNLRQIQLAKAPMTSSTVFQWFQFGAVSALLVTAHPRLGGVRKVQGMKLMPLLLGAAGLLVTSGCISTHLVKDQAQSHLEYRVDGDKWEEVNGKPGYYALLPLTVAGDVATSPFQLGYFLFTDNSHWGSANIRGIPIPLP